MSRENVEVVRAAYDWRDVVGRLRMYRQVRGLGLVVSQLLEALSKRPVAYGCGCPQSRMSTNSRFRRARKATSAGLRENKRFRVAPQGDYTYH
jgi:hypothetical protein